MFAAFVPIWALSLLGYLAGRFRLIGDGADRVLSGFVFHLAMPAALFTTLSNTRLALPGTAMLAFAVGTVVAIGLGGWFSRRVLDRKLGEATIGGMAAGYVNSANLGIPVALHVIGDASMLTGVLLFQVLVVTPVLLTVLDSSAGRRPSARRLAAMPLRNPVLIGLTAGVVCSYFDWHPTKLIADSLDMLGAAAVPAALVALGLSLSARGPRTAGEHREVAVLSTVKILVQPLVAGVVGWLLGLSGPELLAVVVCAALPTAQNCYVFAGEYGQAEAVSRRVVVTTTAVSMVTLAVPASLLG